MFDFNVRISWPVKRTEPYTPKDDIFYWDEPITKNKCFSIQITKWDNSSQYTLFRFNLDLSFWGEDHAGPLLFIDLFNYGLILSLYDKRHWNDEKYAWYTDDDSLMDCVSEGRVGNGVWSYWWGPLNKRVGEFKSQKAAFKALKKRIKE